MKVLIKLGGTLLDDADKRLSMARQLARVAKECDLTVVHGGGKQVTKFLEERGVKSEFLNGLRISDGAVIEAVTQVIAGGVNKQLVAALTVTGCRAVGISGVDGNLITARQLSERLKFTGTPIDSDGRILDILLKGGYLPVVACIAGDTEGNIYNVNADQLAVSCAVGWRADKLFFLTDVPGVRDQDGQTIARLHPQSVQELISSGIAYGGMQAKLESSLLALEGGLEEVIIASGQAENVCQELLLGQLRGTSISLTEAAVV